MSEKISLDEKFRVKASRHTLEAEEIPGVLDSAAGILQAVARLYEGAMERDPLKMAGAAVDVYDQLQRIKREIED